MLQYILKINGMACSMCEAHVNDAIRQNFKVKKIRSSHAKGQCELTAEQELDELIKHMADEYYGIGEPTKC